LKKLPKPIAGVPGDLISRDDERLFEFVDALRVSVKSRVAAEQRRGLSLADIVPQVREMALLAERGAQDPKPFSTEGFRAISRQAVAWCIEAYQPTVPIEVETELAAVKEPSSPAAPTVMPLDRFSKGHQHNRGLS
jgi:hypothetical protein